MKPQGTRADRNTRFSERFEGKCHTDLHRTVKHTQSTHNYSAPTRSEGGPNMLAWPEPKGCAGAAAQACPACCAAPAPPWPAMPSCCSTPISGAGSAGGSGSGAVAATATACGCGAGCTCAAGCSSGAWWGGCVKRGSGCECSAGRLLVSLVKQKQLWHAACHGTLIAGTAPPHPSPVGQQGQQVCSHAALPPWQAGLLLPRQRLWLPAAAAAV